jgi:hypothetical protein
LLADSVESARRMVEMCIDEFALATLTLNL